MIFFYFASMQFNAQHCNRLCTFCSVPFFSFLIMNHDSLESLALIFYRTFISIICKPACLHLLCTVAAHVCIWSAYWAEKSSALWCFILAGKAKGMCARGEKEQQPWGEICKLTHTAQQFRKRTLYPWQKNTQPDNQHEKGAF